MPRTDITLVQRQRARDLRANMTGCELALWRSLKGGRMMGCHFRRQAPIGGYVVDFVCHSRHLVVEADGDHHGRDGQRDHDHKRDRWLASQGYRVLRFTNGQILGERESVLMTIEAALDGRLPAETYAAVPAAMARLLARAPSLSLRHEGGEDAAIGAATVPPILAVVGGAVGAATSYDAARKNAADDA